MGTSVRVEGREQGWCVENWEGRPSWATPQEQKQSHSRIDESGSASRTISLDAFRVKPSAEALQAELSRRHTQPYPAISSLRQSVFLCKDALETIDVIGEVDVAYTHNSTGDDYIYDIWFKASVVLTSWVFQGQGPWLTYYGGQADRGRRKSRTEK